MAPHIGANLPGQFPFAAPVIMKHHDGRFIPATPAAREYPIPELGVAAAACGSRVQPFIEIPYPVEHLPPESHVGAGANPPSRSDVLARCDQEIRAIVNSLVAPSKSPLCLK